MNIIEFSFSMPIVFHQYHIKITAYSFCLWGEDAECTTVIFTGYWWNTTVILQENSIVIKIGKRSLKIKMLGCELCKLVELQPLEQKRFLSYYLFQSSYPRWFEVLTVCQIRRLVFSQTYHNQQLMIPSEQNLESWIVLALWIDNMYLKEV